VNLFTVATLSVVAGCIPQDDYEGSYDMTFDVITTSAAGRTQAMAGTTTVDVKHGLNENYLVHLGDSFCVLEGSYIKAEKWGDKPYMDITPQDCWYVKGANATALPLSLGGTADYVGDDERLEIVLGGSFIDDDGKVGSATVQLTESG
jgi:hypothetical protein